MKTSRAVPILLLITAWAAISAADTIRLHGGAAVTGEIVYRKADTLVVDLGYRILEIPADEVESITAAGATVSRIRPTLCRCRSSKVGAGPSGPESEST